MADNREARIYWLNWKDMYIEAIEREDDSFFELSALFACRIESCAGEGNLLYWAGEELYEDVGFDSTVMYHVRNTRWSWDAMMGDLLILSEEHPEVIFQVTFIEGDAEGKTYLQGGRITTALYNQEAGKLFLAF